MAASKSDNSDVLQVLDGTYSEQETSSKDRAMELRATMGQNRAIAVKNQVAASPTPLGSSIELNLSLERHSPKKKMLTLSSDGKLRSPGSRTSKGIGKAKGRMKKADNEESLKSKVVTLSYGGNNLSRAEMGAKIEAILSGLATMPVESRPAVQRARKPDQPPKTTHPFFIAKAQRTKAEGIMPSDPTTENAAQGRKRSPSPRKKIGIKNAQAAAAWANISGFGSASAISPASKLPSLSGLMEPPWPPRDVLHIRGSMSPVTKIAREEMCIPESQKKLKALAVQIPEHEDILTPYVQLISHFRMDSRNGFGTAGRDMLLRKPVRKLMTGHELQQNLQQMVCSTLLTPPHAFQASEARNLEARVSQGESQYGPPHSAVMHVFDSLPHSQSAFDRFECEMEEWTHKYAPKSAADVLQHGREAFFLRDWLKTLTVASVQSGMEGSSKSRAPLNLLKQGGTKTRKKRKRTDEFAGFMISSDEEASEMGELSGSEDLSLHESSRIVKNSVIRSVEVSSSGSSVNSTRCTNAVVISGPHGCGKTAAVYAVAEELGFEVFEISSGSRRSGKDLLDKVGDMTRNHLVHQASDPKSADSMANQHEESLQKVIDSGRQSTMKGFFKSKSGVKNLGHQSRLGLPASTKPSRPSEKQNHQKQSLILLEEVDILFEEDKQFWTTALGMISQSKRPIIMTCTDESQLPTEDMALHAIFRFHPPSEELAADYLVLVAGNEGHLISRDAVCAFYKTNNNDLRATITGLNFWCQMGIGDDKGGLEWMPIPSSSESCIKSQHGKQRVVSENTFITSMVQLPFLCSHKDLILDRSNIETSCTKINPEASSDSTDSISRQKSLKLLKLVDLALDAVSFADVFPGSRVMDDNTVSFAYIYLLAYKIALAKLSRYCLTLRSLTYQKARRPIILMGFICCKQTLYKTILVLAWQYHQPSRHFLKACFCLVTLAGQHTKSQISGA